MRLELAEKTELSRWAFYSSSSRGRVKNEIQCELRTDFMRDRDRIIHSKVFRRLKHKTQVFLAPVGDHYRTRLTHTLDVSQIARTIAKGLRLNEALTEAIALGHDLGHTPFGHAGEKVLNKLVPGGFTHQEQSLMVVDFLENDGRGLNLTYEVRDGIVKHSKGLDIILPDDPEKKLALTLEGRIVRLADIVAYINHDLDDAIRAGIIINDDIPEKCFKILGNSHSERIGRMVKDIINTTLKKDDGYLGISDFILDGMNDLRGFLFERVYHSEQIKRDFDKARKIIRELYFWFLENDDFMNSEDIYKDRIISRERMVANFIAGMTDDYALDTYKRIFMPRPWRK